MQTAYFPMYICSYRFCFWYLPLLCFAFQAICSCSVAVGWPVVFSRTDLLLVMVNSYRLQSQLLPTGILPLLFVSQAPNHMVVCPWKWRQGVGFSAEKWSLHRDQQFWHEKLIQKNTFSSTAISIFNKANLIKVIKTKTRCRLWKLLCKTQSCATCAGRAFVIPVSERGEMELCATDAYWCVALTPALPTTEVCRQHVLWRISEENNQLRNRTLDCIVIKTRTNTCCESKALFLQDKKSPNHPLSEITFSIISQSKQMQCLSFTNCLYIFERSYSWVLGA